MKKAFFTMNHLKSIRSKSNIWFGMTLILLVHACHLPRKNNNSDVAKTEEKSQKQDDDREKLAFYFMEGVIKKAQNTPKEAIPFFQEALKIDPKHDASMYNIALIYYEMRKPDVALPYASEAFRLKENNLWYARLLSDLYTLLNQPEKSVQILEKSAKKHSDTDIKLLLADQYVRISEFRKAIEMFDSVEVQMGIMEELSIQKHRIYQLLNETDKAALEIKKLIKQFPYEAKFYFLLHDFYIAESQEQEGIDVLKELQTILPENPQNLFKLGEYYRIKRSDTEKAYEYLSKAFTSQQLGTEPKAAYLQKLDEKNEVDLALKTRLTSIFMESGGKHPAMFAMQAKTFEHNNQLDSARTYYIKALEINELNQDMWVNLIELDVKINNISYLTRDCEKGLEVFPNDSRFLKTAGKAYFALHQYDKTIRFLEKIDKLGAISTDELTELYPFIGLSWFYKANIDNAEKWFNKGLENNEIHLTTLESYAFVLISMNRDMEKAKMMLQKAAEIDSQNPFVIRTQALLKVQEKNLPEATKLAEKALEINPKNIELTEFLGDIWFKAGDKQKAMQFWKEAKQKGGSWETLLKKIKDGSL